MRSKQIVARIQAWIQRLALASGGDGRDMFAPLALRTSGGTAGRVLSLCGRTGDGCGPVKRGDHATNLRGLCFESSLAQPFSVSVSAGIVKLGEVCGSRATTFRFLRLD